MQITEAPRSSILYRCKGAAALTDGGYTDLSLCLHCLHSDCLGDKRSASQRTRLRWIKRERRKKHPANLYTRGPRNGVKRNTLTISYIQPRCRQSCILCRKSVWRSNVRQTYVVFLTAVKIGERSGGEVGGRELNSQWGWNVKMSSRKRGNI